MLVMGVLLDSYETLFSPLEVFYGIRFGSKDHIMAQLVNIYPVGITDPFLDLWGPYRVSQRAIYEQIKPYRGFR